MVDDASQAAEGVIKFDLRHVEESVHHDAMWRTLERWRRVLHALGLTGRDPRRYGGYAYGNVSCRVADHLVVSGTQTAGSARLGQHDYVRVLSWDSRNNRIESRGCCAPSSETLSHAAVYDAMPTARCVLHVHHAALWRHGGCLGWPSTPPGVPYGTPEMARSIAAICATVRDSNHRVGIVIMDGHEDGVLAFGQDIAATACLLLASWASATAIAAAKSV